MPDSKRFLHPEAIKRISRLELRARHVVEGFLSGMHRSPYFGQSVEFRQHREYAAGDDLRHVDWKVWARQDRLYVKQYRGRHQSALHAAGRRLAQHALRARADEQVRIRLHDRGQPGLPACSNRTMPSAACHLMRSCGARSPREPDSSHLSCGRRCPVGQRATGQDRDLRDPAGCRRKLSASRA